MATSKFSIKPLAEDKTLTRFGAPKTRSTSFQTSPKEMVQSQQNWNKLGKAFSGALGNLGATIGTAGKKTTTSDQGSYNNLFVGGGGTNPNNQTTTQSLASEPTSGFTTSSEPVVEPLAGGAAAGAPSGGSSGTAGASGGTTSPGGTSNAPGGPLQEQPDIATPEVPGGQVQDTTAPPGTSALSVGGGQGSLAGANVPSKYQAGFNQALATMGPGAAGNVSGAQGTALTTQYSPAKTNDTSSMFVQSDPFMAGLVTAWQDYINPQNQRASLADTYKQMTKDSGIEAIDLELVDMKSVIEGTEDDLRTEITKAGGFATESQIRGLTNARNKQLIKNYNTLLDTRNAKEKYLQTAIGLEQADRQSADQRFESMFSMGTQIATLQNQMQNNARSQMQWLATNVGFDGLYDSTGGDPYYQSLIEQGLGLPQGGLLTAANQAQLSRIQAEEEKALGMQLKQEQVKTEQAQRAKIYSDITESRATTPGTPEYEAAQKKAIESQVVKAEVVLGKVNEATKFITGKTGGQLSSGLIGGLTSWIGGTPAKNLKTKLDTIQANLSFDTLQAMRNASKTGGALGSVSERELELLGATVASLDVGQSPDELKNSLKQVETHYTNWLSANGYSVTPDGDIVPIQ